MRNRDEHGASAPIVPCPAELSSPVAAANLPDRLQTRAGRWLIPCLIEGDRRRPGGALELPVTEATRARLRLDVRVVVELDLGPGTDLVRLRGRAVAFREQSEAPVRHAGPSVVLHLDPGQDARVSYVREVMRGDRHPTARRHRRYATELFVRWDDGVQRHEGRASNLSLGGASVQAPLAPAPGTTVLVSLRDPINGIVEVASTVTWASEGRPDARFGVRFRPRDAEQAAQVAGVVRRHGRKPTPPLVESVARAAGA